MSQIPLLRAKVCVQYP